MMGAIQAGGRSSRMGEDKAWLDFGGQPLIERVLTAAQPVAQRLVIVINPSQPHAEAYRHLAARWQARLLYDRREHCGPLGGIHAALSECAEGEAALILACDLPFLTSEFLAWLCRKHRQGTAQVTVPLWAGRLQPLVAIYDRSCLPAIEEMLAVNQLKVDRLYQRVTTQIVTPNEANCPAVNERLFSNLNSPEDYQLATSSAER
jgi:molybdopterin-guanine dinucleotide biosynthesis protein A